VESKSTRKRIFTAKDSQNVKLKSLLDKIIAVRDKFDAQYDQDGGFRNKYGESDVIYRKHKNCK